MDYEIHYGLANVLNTGKSLKNRRRNVKSNLDRDAKSTRSAVDNPVLDVADQHKALHTGKHKDFVRGPLTAAKKLPNTRPSKGALEGSIKFYNAKKGFGFIKPSSMTSDIYFNKHNLSAGLMPKTGVMVSYELGNDAAGRIIALSVAAITKKSS